MLIFKNRKCFSNEGKMDPAKQGSKREKNIHEARFSEKEGNLLSELQASFAFLSHAERKIAGVLLKDPERFIGCSLRELSALADVSQGSIVNFAGKYAHGGFPHLKLRVAASLGGFREPPFNVVESNDSVKAALIKTDRNLCAALRGTEILNDETVLSRAAERILSRREGGDLRRFPFRTGRRRPLLSAFAAWDLRVLCQRRVYLRRFRFDAPRGQSGHRRFLLRQNKRHSRRRKTRQARRRSHSFDHGK